MDRDDGTLAKKRLTEALDGSTFKEQAVRIQIRIEELLAACEIQLGNTQAAEELLLQLQHRKRPSWFREIDRRRTNLALFRLYQSTDQSQKARDWYSQLFDEHSVKPVIAN